jgi:predicted SnoaL-like aldol condensation-catalyzing enzyme
MTGTDEAGVVLTRMLEMFRSGDVSALEHTISEGYLDHQGLGQGPVRGPEGFASVVTAARSRYHRLSVEVEDLVLEGDRVAVRLRWIGTAADGTTRERESIDIVHVADGLAIEHWGSRVR